MSIHEVGLRLQMFDLAMEVVSIQYLTRIATNVAFKFYLQKPHGNPISVYEQDHFFNDLL